MRFKATLRKIGNSLGVIIPRNVITSYKEKDEIELDVITKEDKKPKVITSKPHKKLVFNAKTGINEWI